MFSLLGAGLGFYVGMRLLAAPCSRFWLDMFGFGTDSGQARTGLGLGCYTTDSSFCSPISTRSLASKGDVL